MCKCAMLGIVDIFLKSLRWSRNFAKKAASEKSCRFLSGLILHLEILVFIFFLFVLFVQTASDFTQLLLLRWENTAHT